MPIDSPPGLAFRFHRVRRITKPAQYCTALAKASCARPFAAVQGIVPVCLGGAKLLRQTRLRRNSRNATISNNAVPVLSRDGRRAQRRSVPRTPRTSSSALLVRFSLSKARGPLGICRGWALRSSLPFAPAPHGRPNIQVDVKSVLIWLLQDVEFGARWPRPCTHSGEFISQITLPIRCVTNLRNV